MLTHANTKPIAEIKVGEYFVVSMSFPLTGLDTECFLYKVSETSYLDENGRRGPLAHLDNWITVDWFEEPNNSSCSCSVQSLMGNGCTCGAIVRYTT